MQRLKRQIGIVVAVGVVLGCAGARAQSMPGNDASQPQTSTTSGDAGAAGTDATAGSGSAGASDNSSAGSTAGSGLGAGQNSGLGTGLGAGSNAGGSLTARQIFAVMEEKPEVVIELKTQVADQMQQQGVSIDANAITDEMLDNEIATDPAVRQKVTLFLRARGYVSDADIAASRTATGLSGDEGMPGFASGSLTTLPGADVGGANLPLALGPDGLAAENARPTAGRMQSGRRQYAAEAAGEEHHRSAGGVAGADALQSAVAARSVHADSEFAREAEAIWVGRICESEPRERRRGWAARRVCRRSTFRLGRIM